MRFSVWLNETNLRVSFGGFFKDGRVVVYVGEKRFVYVTPAWYHDRWKKISDKSPEVVLGQIKRQIETGESWLLE